MKIKVIDRENSYLKKELEANYRKELNYLKELENDMKNREFRNASFKE